MCSDPNGNTWAACYGGISRYKDGSWTSYSYPDSMLFTSITSYSNKIWCATNDFGLKTFDGSNWSTYTTSNGLPSNNIVSIQKDNLGALWIVTKTNGLAEFNGSWVKHTNTLLSGRTVNELIVDKNNTKWILTTTGIIKFANGIWSVPAKLSSVDAKQGGVDAQNNLWFITGDQLMKYTPLDDNITSFKVEGLIYNAVTAIEIDANSTSWLFTYAGISKYSTNWSSIPYTQIDGVTQTATVTNVKIDSKNNLWFIFNFNIVVCYNGSSWITYNSTNSSLVTFYSFQTLTVDKNDYIWVGSILKGLQYYNGTSWMNLTTADGLINNNVLAIAVDGLNNKWIGTKGGISKYDGTSWTNYPMTSELYDNEITTITCDKENRVWIGTEKGLVMFNGSTWITYTTANGLASNFIRSMAIDKSGIVWCGHPFEGITRFDPNKNTWKTFNTADGIANEQVNALDVDNENELFIGTPNGLSIGKSSTVSLMVEGNQVYTKSENLLIKVPITVKNFNKISRVAFSLHFDNTILKYKYFNPNDLYNLSDNDFNTLNAQNGEMSLDYKKSEILCQSVDNGAPILYLYFEVVNSTVDSTEISFNNPENIVIENYLGKELDHEVKSIKFKINDLLASDNTIKESPFSIYPIPSQDVLVVEGMEMIKSLIIFDLTGRMMMISPINKNKTTIDIHDLKQGIYLLKVSSSSGKDFTQQIIKL